MVWLVGSFLVFLGLAGYVLWQERQYWQRQYTELLTQSRAREIELFDQLLKRNGAKPLQQAPPPRLETKIREEVDYSDYEDRLLEREEAGLLTPSQRHYLVTEAREKQMSQEELELALWRKPQIDDGF